MAKKYIPLINIGGEEYYVKDLENKGKIDILFQHADMSAGNPVVSNYSYGGDGWTGNVKSMFILKKTISGAVKKLKILCKVRTSPIILYVMKKISGSDSFVIVEEHSQTPDATNTVEFNNIVLNGEFYIGVSGPIITRTDMSVTSAYQAVTDDINQQTKTLGNYVNNTQYGLILDLSTFSVEDVDPDMFEGTDAAKLQKAFDFCEQTGGRIIINRKYTVSTTITVNHVYESHNRIIVQGISPDAEIDIDATYGFTGVNGSTGGVIFRDLKFYCPDPVNHCHALLNGGEGLHSFTLVNLIFENCSFNNFKFIYYASNYVQSLWFINCIFRGILNAVISTSGYQWYNVNILHCVIEWSAGIGSIGYPEGVNIKHNCIEGNSSGTGVSIAGGAKGCNIEGNYFEANNKDIDLSGLTTTDRNVRIVGNYFSGSTNTIILPSEAKASHKGSITIMNNTKDGNGYMIAGESAQVYKDVFCAFNAGNVTELPDTSLRVIKSDDFFEM